MNPDRRSILDGLKGTIPARRVLLVTTLLILSGMGICNAGEVASPLLGKKAPLFETVDVRGNRFSAGENFNRNSLSIVNFWGLRCGPCIEEMPYLNAIYERYRSRGVEIYGVNTDGLDSKALGQYIAKQGFDMRYTVLSDETLKIVDLYGMNAAPTTVIVDRNGVVVYYKEDFVPGDEVKLEASLKSFLSRD